MIHFVALESILGADLQTILRCIARNAGGAIAGLCAVRAPVWSPNRGRRFHAKEPERRGKAVVLISLPKLYLTL